MTTQKTTKTNKKSTNAPTFYGVSAKDTLKIVAGESDVTKLSNRLAFLQARIAKFEAEGKASKVGRWNRVCGVIIERINAISAAPTKQAVTFTTGVVPAKTKRKSSKKKIADIDALIAQSGMSADKFLMAVAERVNGDVPF